MNVTQINYKMENTSFNANNLQAAVQFNDNITVWSPQPTFNRTLDGNLLGTLRVCVNNSVFVVFHVV